MKHSEGWLLPIVVLALLMIPLGIGIQAQRAVFEVLLSPMIHPDAPRIPLSFADLGSALLTSIGLPLIGIALVLMGCWTLFLTLQFRQKNKSNLYK